MVYWGYDAKTGRLHISSEPTKNLREVMEKLFGHRVLYREGDIIGEYEHVSDPDTVFVHTYYGVKYPKELTEHLRQRHPSAQIRAGKWQPEKHSSKPVEGLSLSHEISKMSSADWAGENLVVTPSEWTLMVRTAKADMTGAMVALYPPEKVAADLAVDGGEAADQLHITLVYFKDKAADRNDWNKATDALEKICRNHFVLEGTIGGFGVFNNPEEGQILWAHPDIPHLVELRQALVEAVEKKGFEVNQEHGFSPHITLKYGHEGGLPKLESPIPIHFDSVYLVRGDEKDEGSKLGDDTDTKLGSDGTVRVMAPRGWD